MPDVLVDTGVLVDHLRGARRLERPQDSVIHCSVITRAELMAGPHEQETIVRKLLG